MTFCHTIIIYITISHKEEGRKVIDEKRKIELFDEFYEWLKNDGLKAIKSERLHKKKIFSSLLNNPSNDFR